MKLQAHELYQIVQQLRVSLSDKGKSIISRTTVLDMVAVVRGISRHATVEIDGEKSGEGNSLLDKIVLRAHNILTDKQ